MMPLDAAVDYDSRGWNSVPIEYRSKKPALGRDWQKVVITTANAAQYFNGRDMNIGVQLGAVSHGLTDVDCDAPEAVAIAPYILPPTGAIFGRASKRNSHWLYYTKLADTVENAAIAYDDLVGKRQKHPHARLIELRIGGRGLAAQTVMPPSVHKTGEVICWEESGEPATVEGDVLQRQVTLIAAYSLLARYWPQEGSGHHDAARVVGGFLARLGAPVPMVRSRVEAIAKAAGSPRGKELVRTAADAAQAYAADKHAFGLRGLRETFGEETANKVAEWLGYDGGSEQQPRNTAGNADLPEIQVVPGELPRIVDQAENALLTADCGFYQRGGIVVRPVLTKLATADGRETMGWRLVSVDKLHAADVMTRTARFLKFNKRADGWVATDAPTKIAETFLARQGEWNLPVLSGIATTPFLRADGTICDRPGYDAISGTLYQPTCEFPTIPELPSRADALAALGLIQKLIAEFPFTSEASCSVALSGFCTAIDRRAMPTAPLHALTAPAAGTGKSLLVDAIALVTTGRFVPVISQGRTEEELEKRLSACLLAGDQLISIDNCSNVLEGSFLCQSLTQPLLNIRLLGHSRNIETPNNALMFATGNNLAIGDDLCRRTLLCEMDAQCEHPEQRHFDGCLADYSRERRPALVAAILTILRAWHISNTRIDVDPLGSFEGWSRRIREALIWLDCDDPVSTMTVVRSNDPKREALVTLLVEWDSALGAGEFTVQQIIDRAITLANANEPAPAFHNALLTIADKRGSSRVVCPVRLGRYLHANAGKIVTGRVLKSAGIIDGYPYWRLAEG
jgi:hypothetical protein